MKSSYVSEEANRVQSPGKTTKSHKTSPLGHSAYRRLPSLMYLIQSRVAAIDENSGTRLSILRISKKSDNDFVLIVDELVLCSGN